MKRELLNLFFLLFITTGITVIMEPTDNPTFNDEGSLNFGEAFGVCLSKKAYGTLECANRGALSVLQSFNEKNELDFGEMRLERAEGYGRDLLDLDYDPKDFGNVVKAAVRLMERRSMKWNLDGVYPGLQMRVGPMLNGNGILEFALNERVAPYSDRQAGPGRQLARHLLLPFLLGFKFNLASLIPLMFGVVLVVTKKALLLTKLALLISGLLGWNSMTSGPGAHPTAHINGFGGYGGLNGLNGLGGAGNGYDVPSAGVGYYEQHPLRPYRFQAAGFGPYGQHVIREVVDVYEADEGQTSRKGKNFAWSKNDGA